MGEVATQGRQRRILLISQDVVGVSMAGPGIRYFHMARVLSQHGDVRLAFPHPDPLLAQEMIREQLPHVTPILYQPGDWQPILAQLADVDVAIFPSDVASLCPGLADSALALVVDGYDPLLAEWLAMEVDSPNIHHWWPDRMRALVPQYLLGDFFICASERQRSWLLGMLEAHGRIHPANYLADPSLRSLVDVVPYGLPDMEPQHRRPTVRGIWPSIGAADKVILWGGGLWRWLDPLTAIHAVAKIWQSRQDIRLIFPGTRHPNPIHSHIPNHNQAAKDLAGEYGLIDRAIFFGDWIPYGDWVNVLLESDVALSLHFDTLETYLSYRSRVLEYLWAGLPVVATRGDITSELASQYGLGISVGYEDVEGVAEAIVQQLALTPAQRAESAQSARSDLSWERALTPLIHFCQNPQRAADRQAQISTPGNPYYSADLDALTRTFQTSAQEAQETIARLSQQNQVQQALIEGYARGRFIRFMRWWYHLRRGVRHRLGVDKG